MPSVICVSLLPSLQTKAEAENKLWFLSQPLGPVKNLRPKEKESVCTTFGERLTKAIRMYPLWNALVQIRFNRNLIVYHLLQSFSQYQNNRLTPCGPDIERNRQQRMTQNKITRWVQGCVSFTGVKGSDKYKDVHRSLSLLRLISTLYVG